jgi:hypothetical protein
MTSQRGRGGGMFEGLDFGNRGGQGPQNGFFSDNPRGMNRPLSSNNGAIPSQRGRGGM